MSGLEEGQKEAVRLLFESAKVMIPVITGFLAVYVGGLGALWKRDDHITTRITLLFAAIPIFLGVIALGLWSGTLPYCIQTFEFQDFQRFQGGRVWARFGHISFFIAVAAAVVFFWSTLRDRKRHQTAT